MAGSELEVRTEGDVVVFEPRGHVDAEAARHLLERVETEAGRGRSVEVDLEQVCSLSEEAAALLLFRCPPLRRLPRTATLRAQGPSARRAVLQAYAGYRAGSPPGS